MKNNQRDYISEHELIVAKSLPSAADLDAMAAEQAIKTATAPASMIEVIEREMQPLLRLGVMRERDVRAAMVRIWEAAQR